LPQNYSLIKQNDSAGCIAGEDIVESGVDLFETIGAGVDDLIGAIPAPA
jgi:hypothetical protein